MRLCSGHSSLTVEHLDAITESLQRVRSEFLHGLECRLHSKSLTQPPCVKTIHHTGRIQRGAYGGTVEVQRESWRGAPPTAKKSKTRGQRLIMHTELGKTVLLQEERTLLLLSSLCTRRKADRLLGHRDVKAITAVISCSTDLLLRAPQRKPPSVVLDLFADLRDGVRLLDLLEVITGQPVIEELASVLAFSSRHSSMESLASVDSCSTTDSTSPRRTAPLHAHFRLSARKALLLWAREQCAKAGCGITVQDFRSSWRSGLAFLAILYSLRPGVVDLQKSRTRTNKENLEEAFRIAEQDLHIPRLLEPEGKWSLKLQFEQETECRQNIDVKDPDEKSIMTYVAQFLQYSKDLPMSEEDGQLHPLAPPQSPSPGLPLAFVASCLCQVHCFTPLLLVLSEGPLSQKISEVTSWLQEAQQELVTSWAKAENDSYPERHNLSACKVALDRSLPAPLDDVGAWLLRVEAVLGEEDTEAQDHVLVAECARARLHLLKALMEEMSIHLHTLQTFPQKDEDGATRVPPEKMEELKRRFTNIRVTAKYHGIKLEYQESSHTVQGLLEQIRSRLCSWKSPYSSREDVRLQLLSWHDSIDNQGLVSRLEAAILRLRLIADNYTSKSALAADSQHISKFMKEVEVESAVTVESVSGTKAMLERVLSAWDSYTELHGSLQAWLDNRESLPDGTEVTSDRLSEWSARHAHLNEVGNLLIEATDEQTSGSLADELRGLNRQWAAFMKKTTFSATQPDCIPTIPARATAVNMLIDEATQLMQEEVDISSSNLRSFRKRIEVTSDRLSEWSARHAHLNEVGNLLIEATDEQTSGSLADELRGLNRQWAAFMKKTTFSATQPDCIPTIPARATAVNMLIDEATQLMQEEVDISSSNLRSFRKRIEVTQELCQAGEGCVELQRGAAMLEGGLAELQHWESLARDTHRALMGKGHSPTQDPAVKLLISRGQEHERQVLTEEQFLLATVETLQKNKSLQHLTVSGMQAREVQAMLSSLADRHRGYPKEADVRVKFEKAKHRLLEHILAAITVLGDKQITKEQVAKKEEFLKKSNSTFLEEFLESAEQMKSRCSSSQQREIETLSQSLRKQWEVCFSAEGSLDQARQHLEALRVICDTLSSDKAHSLTRAQLGECVQRLEAIEQQRRDFCEPQQAWLSQQPPPGERHPSEHGEDKVEQMESFLPSESSPRLPPTEVIVTVETVAVMQRAERMVVDGSDLDTVEAQDVDEHETLERYRESMSEFENQLGRNRQSLQAEFPPDAVSSALLHAKLRELQALREETESLWFEFELQCSQMKGRVAGGEEQKVEEIRSALTRQWRGQQLHLKSRLKSIETAVGLIEPVENQISHFSNSLDEFHKIPKEVRGFELIDGNAVLRDLEDLGESIQHETDRICALGRADSPALSGLNPAEQVILSRIVLDCGKRLEALKQRVWTSEAALRALEHFLTSLRRADHGLAGLQATLPEDVAAVNKDRAKLEVARQSLKSSGERCPGLDSQLNTAQLSIWDCEVSAVITCQGMVSALAQKTEDLDRALLKQQQSLQREKELPVLLQKGEALHCSLQELHERVRTLALKEPTRPALQQRLRALRDLESQLNSHRADLEQLRDVAAQISAQPGELGHGFPQDLEVLWEETEQALTEGQEQCSVLMDLLKKFQGCRGDLCNVLQRAEQTILKQASYMGKDNLQGLLTKVSTIKEDLSGWTEGVEELRAVCRHLQSQLKKIPGDAEVPFEAEADSLVDRWLDVMEKTDSHIDNLHHGLMLWEKLLSLAANIEQWAIGKLATFAEWRHFRDEQEIATFQSEIEAQQENIEHFHNKAAEIQELLQSKEFPLELQVIESQLRKRMEEVEELSMESSEAFQELMAVKKLMADRLKQCYSCLETIESAVIGLAVSDNPQASNTLQELGEQLQVQEQEADSILREVGLMASVASPHLLETLAADGMQLKERIQRVQELFCQKRNHVENSFLQLMSEECQAYEQWLQELQLSMNDCFENPERRQDMESSLQRITEFLACREGERRIARLKECLSSVGAQLPEAQSSSLLAWLQEQEEELNTFRSHCQNKHSQLDVGLRTLDRERFDALQGLVLSARKQGLKSDGTVQESERLVERYCSLQARLCAECEALLTLSREVQAFTTLRDSILSWVTRLQEDLDSLGKDTQGSRREIQERLHRAEPAAQHLRVLQGVVERWDSCLEVKQQVQSTAEELRRQTAEVALRFPWPGVAERCRALEGCRSLAEKARALSEACDRLQTEREELSQLTRDPSFAEESWTDLVKCTSCLLKDLEDVSVSLEGSLQEERRCGRLMEQARAAQHSLGAQLGTVRAAPRDRASLHDTVSSLQVLLESVAHNVDLTKELENVSHALQRSMTLSGQSAIGQEIILLQEQNRASETEILQTMQELHTQVQQAEEELIMRSLKDEATKLLEELQLVSKDHGSLEQLTGFAQLKQHWETLKGCERALGELDARVADLQAPGRLRLPQGEIAGDVSAAATAAVQEHSRLKSDISHRLELCKEAVGRGFHACLQELQQWNQAARPALSVQPRAPTESALPSGSPRSLQSPVGLERQEEQGGVSSGTVWVKTEERRGDGERADITDTQQVRQEGTLGLPSTLSSLMCSVRLIFFAEQEQRCSGNMLKWCAESEGLELVSEHEADEEPGKLPQSQGGAAQEIFTDAQMLTLPGSDSHSTGAGRLKETLERLNTLYKDLESQLTDAVRRVLYCRNQPAKLHIAAMTQQMEETQELFQQLGRQQTVALTRLDKALTGNPDTAHSGVAHLIHTQWGAILQDISAITQDRVSQLQLVTQYRRTAETSGAELDKLRAEMQTLQSCSKECSSHRTERLKSLLLDIEQEKAVMKELLEVQAKISPLLNEIDKNRMQMQLGDMRVECDRVECAAQKILYRVSLEAEESKDLLLETQGLQTVLENLHRSLNFLRSSPSQREGEKAKRLMMLSADVIAAQQKFSLLQQHAEALTQSMLGQREKEEITQAIQILQAKLGLVQDQISAPTISTATMFGKIMKIVQDAFTWAKRTESGFMMSSKIALDPEDVKARIDDMKKVQSEIAAKQFKLQSFASEVRRMIPQLDEKDVPKVLSLLKTLEQLYESTDEKSLQVSSDLDPSQLRSEQQKLLQATVDSNAWAQVVMKQSENLERKIIEELDFQPEYEHTFDFLKDANFELHRAACLGLDDQAIVNEIQRCLILQRDVETRMRILWAVKCRDCAEPGKKPVAMVKKLDDLQDLAKQIQNDCTLRMEGLSQAREAVRVYIEAIQGTANFLSEEEAKLQHVPGYVEGCEYSLQQIQEALSNITAEFESRIAHIQLLFPKMDCLSLPECLKLHAQLLSELLVHVSTVKSKAQLRLEALHRCVEKYEIYKHCYEEVSNSLDSSGRKLAACFSKKVASYKEYLDQQENLKLLVPGIDGAEEKLAQLQEAAVELQGAGGDSREVARAVSSRWQDWLRMQRCARELGQRTGQRVEDWRAVSESVERATVILDNLQDELPEFSVEKATGEELQELLESTEQYEGHLVREQAALSALVLKVRHLLGISPSGDGAQSTALFQQLLAMQDRYTNLRRKAGSAGRAASAEMREREQVKEEIRGVKEWLVTAVSLLAVLEHSPSKEELQEVQIELGSQKAVLEGIMDKLRMKYSDMYTLVPVDIEAQLQEVSCGLQEVEEKVEDAVEKSSPFYAMGAKISDITTGLANVQTVLQQRSKSVMEAKGIQKHVWDELEQWHSRVTALEADVQELSVDYPDQAHQMMDNLMEPLQLYQNVAKQAEQRTALLSKTTSSLQEFDEMISSTNSWLSEALPWLSAPYSYSSAKCLSRHVNALQMVLADSEQRRKSLQDFRPLLQEISTVCDTAAMEEQLSRTDQRIAALQQGIQERLPQLQRASTELEAIETEVKLIEKNITKIRTILSTNDTTEISPEEHLRNRQVILDNIQPMKRTIAEIRGCRPGMSLPEGASAALEVFDRAEELLLPIEELEQVTIQQSAVLKVAIAQLMGQRQDIQQEGPGQLSAGSPQGAIGGLSLNTSPAEEGEVGSEDERGSTKSSSSETLTGSVAEDPEETFIGEDQAEALSLACEEILEAQPPPAIKEPAPLRFPAAEKELALRQQDTQCEETASTQTPLHSMKGQKDPVHQSGEGLQGLRAQSQETLMTDPHPHELADLLGQGVAAGHLEEGGTEQLEAQSPETQHTATHPHSPGERQGAATGQSGEGKPVEAQGPEVLLTGTQAHRLLARTGEHAEAEGSPPCLRMCQEFVTHLEVWLQRAGDSFRAGQPAGYMQGSVEQQLLGCQEKLLEIEQKVALLALGQQGSMASAHAEVEALSCRLEQLKTSLEGKSPLEHPPVEGRHQQSASVQEMLTSTGGTLSRQNSLQQQRELEQELSEQRDLTKAIALQHGRTRLHSHSERDPSQSQVGKPALGCQGKGQSLDEGGLEPPAGVEMTVEMSGLKWQPLENKLAARLTMLEELVQQDLPSQVVVADDGVSAAHSGIVSSPNTHDVQEIQALTTRLRELGHSVQSIPAQPHPSEESCSKLDEDLYDILTGINLSLGSMEDLLLSPCDLSREDTQLQIPQLESVAADLTSLDSEMNSQRAALSRIASLAGAEEPEVSTCLDRLQSCLPLLRSALSSRKRKLHSRLEQLDQYQMAVQLESMLEPQESCVSALKEQGQTLGIPTALMLEVTKLEDVLDSAWSSLHERREELTESLHLERHYGQLLQGLASLVDMGRHRATLDPRLALHSHTDLRGYLQKHKKFFQNLGKRLVMMEHLSQRVPVNLLKKHEKLWTDLVQEMNSLQQKGLEKGTELQRRLQVWSDFDESHKSLYKLLQDVEARIPTVGLVEESDERLSERLSVYQQIQGILRENGARLSQAVVAGRGLRGALGGAGLEAAVRQLETKWLEVHVRVEQDRHRVETLRKLWSRVVDCSLGLQWYLTDCAGRFREDSLALSGWMGSAMGRLKTWKQHSVTLAQEKETLQQRLAHFLEFAKEVEAQSALKASVLSTGAQLLQLKQTDTAALQTQLTQFEQSWTEVLSSLPTVQEKLHQLLMEKVSSQEAMAQLDLWMSGMKDQLQEDEERIPAVSGLASITQLLKKYKEYRLEMSYRQLTVDFVNQSVLQTSSPDVQGKRYERKEFAEQLGALNLQSQRLHGALSDRQTLQLLATVILEYGDADLPAVYVVRQETEEKLRVKSREAEGLRERCQSLDTGSKEGIRRDFMSQVDDISVACTGLSQQLAQMKTSLQTVVQRWGEFEGVFGEVELSTIKVRYSLEHCCCPLLSFETLRGKVESLKNLQDEAEMGEEGWQTLTRAFSSLKDLCSPSAAQLLSDQLQSARTRWMVVNQDLTDELRKAQSLFQLWQKYRDFVADRALLLDKHQEECSKLLSSVSAEESTVDFVRSKVEAINGLQEKVRSLQSSVAQVLEISEELMVQMGPSAAAFVQSESRSLPRRLAQLEGMLAGRLRDLQDELEQLEEFDSSLEVLENHLKDCKDTVIKTQDSSSMQLSKAGMLKLSALSPDLQLLNELSYRVPLNDNAARRLQTLNRQWALASAQAVERCSVLQGQVLQQENFQQKCERWLSFLQAMEDNLAVDIAGCYPSLREQQRVHQRFQAEVAIGHQILHSVINEALLLLEKGEVEDRSDFILKLSQLKEQWQGAVRRAQQRKGLVDGLVRQWQLYHGSLKKLRRFLADTAAQLPPASSQSPSGLHQLRRALAEMKHSKLLFQRHHSSYVQALEGGRQLFSMGDAQTQTLLQGELSGQQEAWEHTCALLEERSTLIATVLENWERCQIGLAESRDKLQEIGTRVSTPLPMLLEELPSAEKDAKAAEESLEDWFRSLTELTSMKTEVSQYIIADDVFLLQEQVEHLHCQWEELCVKVSLRKQEIADRLNAWIIFNEKNKELCEWLTQMENKVARNADLSIEEMVEKLKKDCMEEINLFSENKTHLKQLGEQLIKASNKTKETEVNDKLKDINDRWQHLFDHIEARDEHAARYSEISLCVSRYSGGDFDIGYISDMWYISYPGRNGTEITAPCVSQHDMGRQPRKSSAGGGGNILQPSFVPKHKWLQLAPRLQLLSAHSCGRTSLCPAREELDQVKKLKDTLATVQQLDKNMSNLRTWLSRIETELAKPVIYTICGDDEIQRKLAEQQDLQRDIEQHSEGVTSVLNLCDVLLHDTDACTSETECDSIQQTTRSLDRRWRNICAMSMERRFKIEDTWRLWCRFLEDYSRFEDWLKTAERTAASPNSAEVLYTNAKEELKKFEAFQRQVHERLTQLELVNKQYRRLARENRTDAASRLKLMVHEGNQRWDNLQKRVSAILRRLKHFTSQREEFESTRDGILVWLTEMDLQLTNVEHFSESDIEDKMRQLNGFQQEITLHTNKIDQLIVFGENLIQKSEPMDAVLIEDELEELHSYCQEVFGRVARFHHRLTSRGLMSEEERELSDRDTDLDESSELQGVCWQGEKEGPGTSPSHQAMCHLMPPAPGQERSGRETPVSVDSIPLEWDHTVDVGGSSSHEDEEEATYYSALSGSHSGALQMTQPDSCPCFPLLLQVPYLCRCRECTEWPLTVPVPFQVQLMSECSGSIDSVKRVKLILNDEELLPEEQGLTGLSVADTQSVCLCGSTGVIERWELFQAQALSEEIRIKQNLQQWQQLNSDLRDITTWLNQVRPQLEQLQKLESSASIQDMENNIKKLKEMQKAFSNYKAVMISINLSSKDFQQGDSMESQELQAGLKEMNQSWVQASSDLEHWEEGLQNTLMQCQEFHETTHSLLLWLAHADSRRYALDIHDPAKEPCVLQEHRKALLVLEAELLERQQQVSSLQEISAHLLLGPGEEDCTEARERVHVIANKLKLLLRQVATDLQTTQGRLVRTNPGVPPASAEPLAGGFSAQDACLPGLKDSP
ncbi:SYNE2 protein, partial [Atractosteus spatula]|nr:SYNE2 protein [Atractosteus spatula]